MPYVLPLIPRSWIVQGDADAVVYLRQSEALVNLIQQKLPTTNVRFDIAKGQDHAFDLDRALWEPYAKSAMEFMVAGWLH